MLSAIPHPAARHAVWQYHVATIVTRLPGALGPRDAGVAATEACCNALGGEGWELVSAVPVTDANGQTQQIRLFFKREVGREG